MADSASEDMPLMPRRAIRASLGQPPKVRRRAGRPAHATQLSKEGPSTLAVIVGQREGRWAREIAGTRKAGQEARRQLQKVGLEVEAAGPDRVVGLAALVGWRCVTGEVGHVQSLAMIGASLERHPKRKLQRFLEHRVLASTELSADVPLPAGWQYAPAKASCRQVLDAGKALGVRARDRFGQQVSLGQLLSDWASRLGVNVAEGMLWPVFTPIAVGMVQRSWFGDVSRWSPVAHGRLDMAPCRPSVGLLRHFGRQPVCYELPSGQLGQRGVSV